MLLLLLTDLYGNAPIWGFFFSVLAVVAVLGLSLQALSAHVDRQFEREPEPELPAAPQEGATWDRWEDEQYGE